MLLHGFPQTWYEWHRIMPQLAEHYTVVAPDLRGSSKPPPEAGYDTGTLAEDLHALVRHLGFESIRLVGHDVGLMVAYAYAATYRDEVSKLVLLDAPIPGIEPAWSGVMAQLWHFRFHQVRDLPEQLLTGREREYLTWFYTAFKAWVDQVARAGLTFRYTEAGAVGLVEGVRAYAVVASSGTGVGSDIDFLTPYLRFVLGFIGITDVEVVAADRLLFDPEATGRALERVGEIADEHSSFAS